ncbi:DUF748 domain-containing protein [Marinomonas sp. TW1]|uniref:DUF748 domain-containing protein n=1 Tax=Marinomonas sp. TW1 TaxID=1561203 RepID=UPI0007AFCF76|nr:DUF748 domain-containing protein [Marinomonas sp. TW1]KZN13622.1 hypothetical protein OA79_09625 [Marinomonas sp. TW1]
MITRRQFRLFVFYPVLVISLVMMCLWGAAPFVAKHYLQDFFQQHGQSATLDAPNIDFFPPRLEVNNLIVQQQNVPTLTLEHAEFAIEFWPLFNQTLAVSIADIAGLNLNVEQQANNWIIAGLDLAKLTSDSTEKSDAAESNQSKADTDPNASTSSWGISVPQIQVKNAFVDLTRNTKQNEDAQTDRLGLTSLEVQNLIGQGLDWQADIALSAQVNDATLRLDSQLNYQKKQTNFVINTLTTDLSVDSIRHFLPVDYQATEGDLTLNAALLLEHNANSGQFKLNVTSFNLDLQNAFVPVNQEQSIRLHAANLDLKDTQLDYAPTPKATNADHDTINLTAATKLTIKASDVAIQQGEQSLAWQTLDIASPIKVIGDESGYQLTSDSSTLALAELKLSSDSLILSGQTLALELANLDLTLATDKQIKVAVDSQFNSQQMAVKQAGNRLSYQSLTLDSQLAFSQDAQHTQAQSKAFSLQLDEFNGDLINGQSIALQTTQLMADQLTLNQTKAQQTDPEPIETSLSGQQISLNTKGLDSYASNDKRLAAWQSSQLSGVNFEQQGDVFSVQAERLDINQITLSDDLSAPDRPALATLGQVSISQLEADQDTAKIDSIHTQDVVISLLLDAEKNLTNLVSINNTPATLPEPKLQPNTSPRVSDLRQDSKSSSTEPTQTKTTESGFKAPYQLVLNQYAMTGSSHVYVKDDSISPALERTLDIDTLTLANLNTQDEKQAMDVTLKAHNGKYTKIQSDVTLWPLADRLTMQSELTIKEAELPPYSAYLASVLGYQIDSGQLDLDLKLHAQQGLLDGNAHVLLREFDLGGQQESGSVMQAGVIPLNIAVGILKDSDNNIDLDIPLSGDIDNPEFGWRNFLFLPVRKALYSASSNYLMQTFIPYANVISIAQLAGDQLLKIRVAPLTFAPTETQLSENQNDFLVQLSQLMKDKEDSQLKACGVTSYVDLGFDTPPATLDENQKAQARELAQARADRLKDYLVSSGIRSSRILLCSPEIDLSKDSQPRVELNF